MAYTAVCYCEFWNTGDKEKDLKVPKRGKKKIKLHAKDQGSEWRSIFQNKRS